MQVVLLAGLVPFGVLFIELMFVFKSVWQDKSGYYYVFGYLSAVSTILVITVSEVTIITTYIQLCSEVCHGMHNPAMTPADMCLLELPLVVAELLRGWRQRSVGVCLLRLVLCYSTAYSGVHLEHSLLQLQLPGLRCLWASYRHGWVLDSVYICQASLQVSLSSPHFSAGSSD
jgi:Endomembrane protein 70